MTRRPRPLQRYAAKLLFQFRVVTDGAANKRRTCEERIIQFKAPTVKDALRYAKRYGRDEQHSYKNNSGGKVYFEFVGVMELLHLGAECEPNEVWYEIIELLKPMERRRRFLPPEAQLNAVAWMNRAIQQRVGNARAKGLRAVQRGR
jgi:hypothetical protein